MKTIPGILILAALVLAGCSTAVSPEKSARIDPQKTGLVLATLECRGAPEDVATKGIQFALEPLDRPDRPSKYAAITSEKSLWLLEVPPGRYRLANWYYSSFYGYKETAVTGFEFEVKPGRVTYLGHLQAKFLVVENEQGQRKYVRVRAALENHFEQAVPDFREKYPALAGVPVDNIAPREFALYPTTIARSDSPPIDYMQYQRDFPPPLNTTPRMLSPY